MSYTILGAGLAGLITATQFQTAEIFEAQPASMAGHRALLRFRSRAVSDATGIPFRKVLVRKGIWQGGRFHQPNIQLANNYAQKVIGRLLDRSIWNIETVERYIAPEDFHEQLVERAGNRIHWETPITAAMLADLKETGPVLSTLPMKLMATWFAIATQMNAGMPEFTSAPIAVKRWRIPNADVYQTVYYPDLDRKLYRASITKDLLIAEYVDTPDDPKYDDHIFLAFGLDQSDCQLLDSTKHRMGKIAPIDDEWRKAFMFKLTHEHNIYSVGRYGCWKNLLLDDVVQDLAIIRKLMGTSSYAHRLASL